MNNQHRHLSLSQVSFKCINIIKNKTNICLFVYLSNNCILAIIQNIIYLLQMENGNMMGYKIQMEEKNTQIKTIQKEKRGNPNSLMEGVKFYYIEPIKKRVPSLSKKPKQQIKKPNNQPQMPPKRVCDEKKQKIKFKIRDIEECRQNYQQLQILQKLPMQKTIKVMDKDSGDFYLAKIVPKHGLIVDPIQELYFYKKIKQKNKIVTLFEAYQSEHQFIYIYDYYEHNLTQYSQSLIHLSEQLLKKIAKSACQAILVLHRLQIVHRDIKADNFMVHLKQGKDFCLKIKDVSVAQEMEQGKKIEQFIGTPNYVAPQVLYGQYGMQCDVWSLGIMLYKLVAKKFPFISSQMHENVYESICKSPLNMNDPCWCSFSGQCQNFIQQLLVKKPCSRLTIKQCLEHAWLN